MRNVYISYNILKVKTNPSNLKKTLNSSWSCIEVVCDNANDKKKITGREERCCYFFAYMEKVIICYYLKHDFLKLSLSLLGSG